MLEHKCISIGSYAKVWHGKFILKAKSQSIDC